MRTQTFPLSAYDLDAARNPLNVSFNEDLVARAKGQSHITVNSRAITLPTTRSL
jgi:hypothetical protein